MVWRWLVIPAFSRLQQEDRVIQQLQSNVGASLDPLTQNAIVNGRLVSFTATADIPSNTDFTISHGLGRVPAGIIPTASTVNGLMYVSPSVNPNPSQLMIMRCTVGISAAQTVQFWVF